MTQILVTPEVRLIQRAYTIAQAAQILGVHKVNVYRRIYEGKLKTLSGFPRLMISAVELDRFLDRSEVYTPRKRKIECPA